MSSSSVLEATPEVLAGPLPDLVRGVRRVLAEDVAASPVDELAERIQVLHRMGSQLHAALLDAVGAFDAVGGAQQLGRGSTSAWLRDHTRAGGPAAGDLVRTSRALRDHLPATRESLGAGRITGRHASAVAAVVHRVGEVHAELAEPILVRLAEHADPRAVRVATRRVWALTDPVAADQRARRQVEQAGVSLSSGLDGVGFLDGTLDPESAETLTAALLPLMTRTGADDIRGMRRLRLDALVELARRALDSGGLPDSGGQRPHVSLVIDEAELRARGASVVLPWTGGVLPMQQARRLLCDAEVVPVVARALAGGGWLPLAVGRSSRLATPAMLRALRVRDGGCVWRGCSRTPEWCDAHHGRHWADGGETALDNLVLLCRHHHRQVHGRGVGIESDPERPGLMQLRHPGGRVEPAQHTGDRSPPVSVAVGAAPPGRRPAEVSRR